MTDTYMEFARHEKIIKEHKGSYNFSKFSSVLQQACFEKKRLRFGYFKIFMNTWVTATK